MTYDSLTPAKAAQLSAEWALHTSICDELFLRGTRENVAYAEPLIHELAHAAVFGIRPSENVARDVAARFARYPATRSGKRASDLAECAALSVEKSVLLTLGWRVCWREVERIASADMYLFVTPNIIRREVLIQDQRTINADRAGRVICWLWQFTRTAPPAGHGPNRRRNVDEHAP